MSDQLLSSSGYVYCVRRSGKTHYRIGSAPAGQLVDRLKKLAQTEENPTTLVLVGWIEVQDHALAARTLREIFHLYRLKDHWFDFRVAKSSELKSLLGSYADLMVKFPVAEPLIVHEPQPEYDRSFGFFEALHAVNKCDYFPPEISGIPVFPLPEKQGMIQQLVPTPIRQILFKPSHWTPSWKMVGLGAMGLIAGAIGLSSIYGIQAIQSPVSTANQPPSSKPSTLPEPQLTPPPSTPTPPTNQPKPSPSTAPKPKKISSQKPTAVEAAPKPIVEALPNSASSASVPSANAPSASTQSTIWSDSFGGARLRSNPDDLDDAIDFLPNGTPIVLGETSGAWQEVILPDGRRGWIFNDLIPD